MSEKEGIIRFQYKTNTIIYNPDYYTAHETLKKLDPSKYTFKNQRINSLAKEYLENEFGALQESTMNNQGDKIFHSEFIRNCQFNGWVSEPKSDDLKSYDYNKHYTSCLMGEDVKFGFPIYNVFRSDGF